MGRSVHFNKKQLRLFYNVLKPIPTQRSFKQIVFCPYEILSWGDMPFNRLYRSDKYWSSLQKIIRKRDNYRCQFHLCGVFGTIDNKSKIELDVHHIDYNKNNMDEKNMITLCHKCHGATQFKRTMWEIYFKDAIEKIYNGTWEINPIELISNDIQQEFSFG